MRSRARIPGRRAARAPARAGTAPPPARPPARQPVLVATGPRRGATRARRRPRCGASRAPCRRGPARIERPSAPSAPPAARPPARRPVRVATGPRRGSDSSSAPTAVRSVSSSVSAPSRSDRARCSSARAPPSSTRVSSSSTARPSARSRSATTAVRSASMSDRTASRSASTSASVASRSDWIRRRASSARPPGPVRGRQGLLSASRGRRLDGRGFEPGGDVVPVRGRRLERRLGVREGRQRTIRLGEGSSRPPRTISSAFAPAIICPAASDARRMGLDLSSRASCSPPWCSVAPRSPARARGGAG